MARKIVQNFSKQLNQRYGKGWGYKTLQHCIRAAYTFSEDKIVYALHRQFYWSHLRSIMYTQLPDKKFLLQDFNELLL